MAPLLGISISTVSLILLALNCLYIIINSKIARPVFRKKHVFYWFVFLVFWPLLATLYSTAINYRELVLQMYFFTLLLATAVYLLRNGFNSFHRIITAALIVTISGLILSMFMETFFQSVASITDNDLQYGGRAYGFFMQPNLAARSSILLFIIWFAGLRKTKTHIVFLALLGLLILVSLTGSRGGFVIAVVIVLLIFINKYLKITKPFKIMISPKYITLLLVFGCFLACIPLLLDFLTVTQSKPFSSFDVAARIKAISQMKLTEKSSEGESTVANRIDVFKHYSAMIGEHPILGNGFGSITLLQSEGVLGKSSHNQYLKIAFETGLLRLVFYLFLLVSLYFDPRRKRTEQSLQTNSYAQVITSVVLAGMVSNTVLDSRVLYCVMGCFIAMLISLPGNTGRYTSKGSIENLNHPVDSLELQYEK